MYLDSEGYASIGIGRLIDGRVGGGLSEPEIDLLFDNDYKSHTTEALLAFPWLSDHDPVRQAAIMNMVFQMGARKVAGFFMTLQYFKARDYARAAEQVLKSLYAQQTPARAFRVSEQIRTGEWQ